MPLTFSRPISHGADHLHTPPSLSCRRPGRLPRITIGTLDIWDGWGFSLAQAIRAVERGGFDVMLLTETKIQSEEYLHNHLGYGMTCFAAWPYSNRDTRS